MAAALGAIRGFLHLFTDNRWHDDAPHLVTILDVLEPRAPQD